MNILLLCCTTKRRLENSYCQVYVQHIRSLFPAHTFEVMYVSKNIDAFISDADRYNRFVHALRRCDGLLWQVPVYSAGVPAQTQQFIEHIAEDEKVRSSFENKHFGVITSSVQVFDHYAEYYLQAVCERWGGRYVGGFTGIFLGPISEEYRAALQQYLHRFFSAIAQGHQAPRRFFKETTPSPTPELSEALTPTDLVADKPTGNLATKRIGLIADLGSAPANLKAMVEHFSQLAHAQIDILDLSTLGFGGCSGCMKCLENNQCKKGDDFMAAHQCFVVEADAVVYAAHITHGHVPYRLKQFIDREFYLQHLPVYQSKPVALLLSGNVNDNPFVQESLDALLALRGGRICSPVTDQNKSAEEVINNLKWLTHTLSQKMEADVVEPHGFHGAATERIFRDFTYLVRFPFVAEYKAFKNQGRFRSFPQNLKKIRFSVFMLRLLFLVKGFPTAYQKFQSARLTDLRKKLPSETPQ